MLKQLLDLLLKAPAKPDDSALKEFERTLAHAQRGYLRLRTTLHPALLSLRSDSPQKPPWQSPWVLLSEVWHDRL